VRVELDGPRRAVLSNDLDRVAILQASVIKQRFRTGTRRVFNEASNDVTFVAEDRYASDHELVRESLGVVLAIDPTVCRTAAR
jgi:hypothetical protein